MTRRKSGKPHPNEIRECAEVPFVPAEKSEHKDIQPFRSDGCNPLSQTDFLRNEMLRLLAVALRR
jgi:hypothetical protein